MLFEKLIPKNMLIEKIFLDIHNPRFLDDLFTPSVNKYSLTDEKAQELTRRILIEKYGANQLVESIQRVGFLKIDKIIVRKYENDNYIVVEGNRRVAAIKTILGLVKSRRIDLDKSILQTLTSLDVLLISEETENIELTSAFLQGIRHISGVKNWGPYQQGRLIQYLVEENGYNFQEASLSVGLSPSRVSVILRAYQGLVQMQKDILYEKSATTSLFSHFEQAYIKIPIREWLGWDKEKNGFMNKDNLHFFYDMITIHGYKAQEVRDYLPAVLVNKKVCNMFMSGDLSLNDAFFMTKPRFLKLDSLLRSAVDTLLNIDSHNLETTVKEQEMISQLHSISKLILQRSDVPK